MVFFTGMADTTSILEISGLSAGFGVDFDLGPDLVTKGSFSELIPADKAGSSVLQNIKTVMKVEMKMKRMSSKYLYLQPLRVEMLVDDSCRGAIIMRTSSFQKKTRNTSNWMQI
jgi:hypothetical protein